MNKESKVIVNKRAVSKIRFVFDIFTSILQFLCLLISIEAIHSSEFDKACFFLLFAILIELHKGKDVTINITKI